MFLGHFGVSFGAKTLQPRVSLGTLFLATQLADLVWPTLLLLGVERVRIVPHATATNAYNNEPTTSYDDETPVEDIPHETEEETLSLDIKEREMILKALKKHNNKRKYAAHDLGISERTLYRKLKQYDLEQV